MHIWDFLINFAPQLGVKPTQRRNQLSVMPKKIIFTDEITDRMIIFNDIPEMPEAFRGKKLPILDPVYCLRYDDAIDFDGQQVIYAREIVNGNTLATLNDLIKTGWISNWKPFKECSLYLVDEVAENAPSHFKPFRDFAQDSNPHRLSIKKVVAYFAEQGFSVSPTAIRHNYEAWKDDWKSGYRDKKNGVHVFSPCGCNPLQFHVSELHPTAEDWQITYEC